MTNTVPRPPLFNSLGEMDARYWTKNDPLAMGPEGPEGPEGPQGIPGPRGEEGQSVRIRWIVASALDLPAVNVSVGDGTLVGAGPPYTLYVYTNEPTPGWHNAGMMTAGPQGPEGPQGPPGPPPTLAGSGSAITAARSDHNHDGIYSPATHVHSADSITSGMLSADRIPGLDGSKITAGTVPLDRLPAIPTTKITGILPGAQVGNIDAAQVAAGTLLAARIPGLDTSKITTGTFPASRIPTLPTSHIGTGVFSDSLIPNINANKVTAGVFSPDRIPTLTLGQLFPNTHITTNGTSAMRVAPGNSHASLGTLGAGLGIHDTGYRKNTDEMWAYVMIPGIGLCWIPANRIA